MFSSQSTAFEMLWKHTRTHTHAYMFWAIECKCKQCVSRIIVLEWMSLLADWMTDKEPIFWVATRTGSKEMRSSTYLILYFYCCCRIRVPRFESLSALVHRLFTTMSNDSMTCIAFSCLLSSPYIKNWNSKQFIFLLAIHCYIWKESSYTLDLDRNGMHGAQCTLW